MFEPTEREFDEQVKRSIDQFERSRIGETSPIEPRRPEKMLLVLDGSQQDETGVALSGKLQSRFGCRLAVMDGREQIETNHHAEETARRLGVESIDKCTGDSYEQILSAVERYACDLIVVPSPFGHDLDKVGSDSTGTVIDVLLTRSCVPLLVVRRKFPVEEQPFSRVQLVLIGETDVAQDAAAWAAGLVAEQGELQLALELPGEVLEEVRKVMRSLAPDQEIEPEQIEAVMQRSAVRTHRGLQLAAESAGFDYHLAVHHDDPFHFETFDESRPGWLLVLPLDREDPASEGRVHDRIRRSPLPVLVVPRERRE